MNSGWLRVRQKFFRVWVDVRMSAHGRTEYFDRSLCYYFGWVLCYFA
jgi:hypothetical protein